MALDRANLTFTLLAVSRIINSLRALQRVTEKMPALPTQYAGLPELIDQGTEKFWPFQWVLEFPCELDSAVDVLLASCPVEQFASDFEVRSAMRSLDELEKSIRKLSRALMGRADRTAADLPDVSPRIVEATKQDNLLRLARQVFTGRSWLADVAPYRILVNATDFCNYRCKTCYQSHEADEIAQYDLSYSDTTGIEEIFESAVLLQVGGFGEPLLSPITPRLLAIAKSFGVFCSITTNGSLLMRLAGIPELDRIEISFDGASARVLEGIRTGANREKILQGIRALSPSQKSKVCFNVVVNRINVREIEDLTALGIDLGIREVVLQSFDAYLPWHKDMLLRAEDLPELEKQMVRAQKLAKASGFLVRDLVARRADPGATAIDPGAALEKIQQAGTSAKSEPAAALVKKLDRALDIDVETGFFAWLRTVEMAAEPVEELPENRSEVPYCLAPFNSIVLNSDGTVHPCCRMNWHMGNINEQSIEEIWNSPPYLALRNSLITQEGLSPICVRCTDSVRFAYLPEFLSALEEGGGDASAISLPQNSELPPDVAADPLVRKLNRGNAADGGDRLKARESVG